MKIFIAQKSKLYHNWLRWSQIHKVNKNGVYYGNQQQQPQLCPQNIQNLKQMINQFMDPNQASLQNNPQILDQHNVSIRSRTKVRQKQLSLSKDVNNYLSEQSEDSLDADGNLNIESESMRQLIGEQMMISAREMFIDLGDHMIQVKCSHFEWKYYDYQWNYKVNNEWLIWNIKQHDLLYSNWKCWSKVTKIDRNGVFKGNKYQPEVDTVLSDHFNFETGREKKIDQKLETNGIQFVSDQINPY